MARNLNRRSRWVYRLKVMLPITALALLSMLFLLARRVDYEGALRYVEADVHTLANDPRLGGATYSGVRNDGAIVKVKAESVKRGGTEGAPLAAINLTATIDRAGDPPVTLTGDSGTFEQDAGVLTLEGNATMTTGDGYRLTAEQMTARTGQTDITAERNVAGSGPFGTISADRMTLTGPAGQQELVFKGNVRVIYRPEN